MTSTDQTFEDAKPGYYIYGKEREARCMLCSKKFKTNLESNRFCTHSHQQQVLRELTGQKR